MYLVGCCNILLSMTNVTSQVGLMQVTLVHYVPHCTFYLCLSHWTTILQYMDFDIFKVNMCVTRCFIKTFNNGEKQKIIIWLDFFSCWAALK